ncbi:hypothetical protein FQN60_015329 [Etheostoma spectabile]|uniref:Uncharacterized protein n=1 Tax=Etheostoma spectabile TaxID=54343 RepID=A0A5J5CXT7_9PERO|nr:hypothetical protein FQN60_015329 [Etheostoma spectabile]
MPPPAATAALPAAADPHQQKHAHTHPQSLQSQQHTHTAQAQQRQPSSATASPTQPNSELQPLHLAEPTAARPPSQEHVFQPKQHLPGQTWPLPANLDDLKVSELQHLRIRGMPVRHQDGPRRAPQPLQGLQLRLFALGLL